MLSVSARRSFCGCCILWHSTGWAAVFGKLDVHGLLGMQSTLACLAACKLLPAQQWAAAGATDATPGFISMSGKTALTLAALASLSYVYGLSIMDSAFRTCQHERFICSGHLWTLAIASTPDEDNRPSLQVYRTCPNPIAHCMQAKCSWTGS